MKRGDPPGRPFPCLPSRKDQKLVRRLTEKLRPGSGT